MIEISDEQFAKMVGKSMDLLAKQMDDVKNVGIVIAAEPTPEQRKKLELRGNETLFGLYEGIPLTKRTNNYSGVLPDKITLFKLPLAWHANDLKELQEEIHKTLWHELAHHFGLDHDRIHELE